MDQFIETVVRPVLLALLTALAAAAVPIAVQYIRRLGFQISAEKEAQVRATAESAVLRAEEIIEAKIKERGGPIVNSGRQKLEEATKVIVAKVPGISPQEAEGLAKEAVARVGLGATAAAGKLVAASQT